RHESLHAGSHHLLESTFGKFRAISFACRHKYGDHVSGRDDPLVRSESTAVSEASLGKESHNAKWPVHNFPDQSIVSARIPTCLHADGLGLPHGFNADRRAESFPFPSS